MECLPFEGKTDLKQVCIQIRYILKENRFMIIDRCCEHIVEVLESLFQEMTFMVSYEGEIGKNQTKDLGMKHAEQKRR